MITSSENAGESQVSTKLLKDKFARRMTLKEFVTSLGFHKVVELKESRSSQLEEYLEETEKRGIPVEEYNAVVVSRLPRLSPNNNGSNYILIIPSNSFEYQEAAKELVFPRESEVLVTEEELEVFNKFMRNIPELPNSMFKKSPKLHPPPDPTFEELLQIKVMEEYYKIYPKQVKVEEPEKKNKKEKELKTPKPSEEEIDFTAWRRKNLPAASTRLHPVSKSQTPSATLRLSSNDDIMRSSHSLRSMYKRSKALQGTDLLQLPEPLSFFGEFLKII